MYFLIHGHVPLRSRVKVKFRGVGATEFFAVLGSTRSIPRNISIQMIVVMSSGDRKRERKCWHF